MKCELCDKTFNGRKGLSSHLRQTHGITTLDQFREYYDKYILDEDLTCPVCKIHQKKFYSFKDGYTKTCVGQLDGEGNKLQCRASWANRDRDKASKAQILNNEYMKTTPSKEDPTKTIFQMKQDKWYDTMTQEDENGKTKFDLVGEKVSDNHMTINPKTGLTKATDYAKRSAISRMNIIMDDGKSLAQHTSLNAANTVMTTIMPDGKTQKEHMTQKAIDTKYNTILPNGLNIWQDTARQAYDTKLKNGTLPKYHGYSKVSEKIFTKLIDTCHLDKENCLYAENEFGIIDKENHTWWRYDFCYMINNKPIIAIEFQGNMYHIKESEIATRINDTNPHGELLIHSYDRDETKKNLLLSKYPNCKYYTIWEDEIEENLKPIIDFVKFSKLNH